MNKKKVSKIIAYVLLAAVLIMTAGLVLTFTRGGTTSFKTFYAEHNGKKLFGDEQLSLPGGEEQRFDVKYTFDAFVEEEEKGYSVSIITCGTEDNQFTYTVNGQPFGFDENTEVDVSEYFNLKKEEDHFTMELPADFSMASVLGYIHGGKAIEVAKSVDISAGWYFALKIQSYNEESTIILPFRQAPEEFEIDFNLKGVKADRKNPKVALGGYNETKLNFTFEEGFGPEGLYVLAEKCGSFNYEVEDGKLIVIITDPGPGVEVTVTAIQQSYKLIADELVGVEPVKNNPDTIGLGKSVLLTFKLKEGYELEAYDALGGTIRLEEHDDNTITFKLSYEPGEYGDIHYCIYAAPGDGASFPVEVVYTTGALTPSTMNPQKVPVDGKVQLLFTINPGYVVGRVVSSGAEVDYTYTDQTLSISVANPTADVTIGVETRPGYDITINTTGVIVNASSDTRLVDGSNAILYFTAMKDYILPETVTVLNASYEWDQSTGELELREPTGPVTVIVNAAEIVPNSYAITTSYTTGHFIADESNAPSIEEGATVYLKFTISPDVDFGTVTATGATVTHSVSGQELTVIVRNPTGPVNISITSRPMYNITVNLTNVSAVSGNSTSIIDGLSATLYFNANAGYSLPESVTVTNADYTWTQSSGKLVLREPTGPVTVTVVGAEIVPESYAISVSYDTLHLSPYYSNPSSIQEGDTVTLKFTISANVEIGSVNGNGAVVTHSVSGQLLTVTLKKPTGTVSVTISSRYQYKITTDLTYVSAVSGNPTTVADGSYATLYFTARSGYSLPASVTVTNAGHQWDQSTGKLVIREPSGPVTVKITGVEFVPNRYSIDTSYTAGHFVAASTNPTSIQEGSSVQLKFTISGNADFGTVTATGATVSHTVSGQTLTVTLNNPTGPVTVTITSRSMYSITTNLSNVSAVSGNASSIIDGLSATLYFNANSGYRLPESVTVTNADYTWTQSSGRLVLREPTGPVTVSMVGVEIVPESYTISPSYNMYHMTSYSTNPSSIQEGATITLRYTIHSNVEIGEVSGTGAIISHSVSGQALVVTVKNPTGPVTVTITSRSVYSITTNLSDVSGNGSNPTTITDGLSATLYFTANSGYRLPATVTVTNAQHQWDQTTGRLIIREANGPVTVTVTGVSNDRPTYSITTNLGHVTANAGNDTTLSDSSNAILYFTAVEGYLLPESVTVTGADHEWDRSTGKLELREPTGPVTVTVIGVEDPNVRPAFDIQVTMLGVNASASNPTVIYDNSSATLYFTAKPNYYLPSSVTVSGAQYQWDHTTGKLVLQNPTGKVTIEILGGATSGPVPYVVDEEMDK